MQRRPRHLLVLALAFGCGSVPAQPENVAASQTTARQVVQEWLSSPVHCAALMRAELTEMGVAYAVNLKSDAGIYWSQKLAFPQQR